MAGEVRVLELRTPMGQWLSRLTDTGSPRSGGELTHPTTRPVSEVFISISERVVPAAVGVSG